MDSRALGEESALRAEESALRAEESAPRAEESALRAEESAPRAEEPAPRAGRELPVGRSSTCPALGLVAGGGGLPLALAGAAVRRGRAVQAVAFRDHTQPRLEEAAHVTWLSLGEIQPGLDAFGRAGVREVVLAGALPKARLLQADTLAADSPGRRLLGGLPDHRDDSLLAALVGLFESHGIALLPQASVAPELVAGAGLLAGPAPGPALWRDIQRGFRVAKRSAADEVGQTVVVKQGVVLAVEAIEGSDAAIRRAGEFAAGACAVKVAAPQQDPRFDLPVLGPGTLRSARDAGLSVVAFEAGSCLVLERERLVAEANRAGVSVVGVNADSFAPGAARR